MNSKIIQISATTAKETPYLYALCEDGSVWRKFGISGEWTLISEPLQKKGSQLEIVKRKE